MKLSQFRTIKTPCCKRKIRISFPYGQLKTYLFCPFCYAHYIVEFSKTKSKRRLRRPYKFRAYELVKKVLIK